jgi:hypothetical protein
VDTECVEVSYWVGGYAALFGSRGLGAGGPGGSGDLQSVGGPGLQLASSGLTESFVGRD